MSNKENIPGIYNWCDRWCERCAFAQRCAVAQSEREDLDPNHDMDNDAFWAKLSHNFSQITELLKNTAKEHGIDLEDISNDEWDKIEKKERSNWDAGNSHPISILSKEYLKMADQWLDSSSLEDESEAETQKLTLGLQQLPEAQQKAASLNDCLEVIRWYLFFIPVKSQRVVMEKIENDEEEDATPETTSYNGTAKILLMAISRSINAWAMLLQFFPNTEDQLIPILATLQKLEKTVQQEFPDADKFKRPGFDD